MSYNPPRWSAWTSWRWLSRRTGRCSTPKLEAVHTSDPGAGGEQDERCAARVFDMGPRRRIVATTASSDGSNSSTVRDLGPAQTGYRGGTKTHKDAHKFDARMDWKKATEACQPLEIRNGFHNWEKNKIEMKWNDVSNDRSVWIWICRATQGI
jgi:hypothetical protein